MSHNPAVVAKILRAAREATATLGNFPGTNVMSLFSPPSPDRIPLFLRPSQELHTRAIELSRMAATARTADARIALETLAARFAVIATQRERAEELMLNHDNAEHE